MSQNVNFLHKILLRARYFFHNVLESNVSKLKREGLRKRVSPPITMGSLFDVAAVSFLLTKEWSKFASEAEARDLIGVMMRWVHEIQSLLSLLRAFY